MGNTGIHIKTLCFRIADILISGESNTKHNPSSPILTPPSKRTKAKVKQDEADDHDEDDEEPVQKRRRRGKPSTLQHPTKGNGAAAREANNATPSEAKSKAAANPKSKNIGISSISDGTKKTRKDSVASSRAQGDKLDASRNETVTSTKAVQVPEDEADTASEVEQDDVESDEEDHPEIAAKAREKVQTTLKSSGKDPFPDWKAGEPVPYGALCTTFSLIEMTTKRLIILAHCSLFLRQVLRLTPDDLLPTIQLMINKLAADYAGIELGIGESLIMKAIGESTGRSLQVIKADQNEIGDLGLVAAKSRSNQPTMFKPKALTVRGVLAGLMDIATTQGDGSQARKVGGIKKLLSSADAALAGKGSKGIDITKDKGGASEAKFIIRFLEGKLRLGLAEKTVLVALAHAMVIHETEKKGNKTPSSEQLAKGESVLKTVYRYARTPA